MKKINKKIKGCSCSKCVSCCWNSPCWFGSIEEIEGAAKIMELNVRDFAKEYLIREWWAGDEIDDISVPAPRKDFLRKDEDRKECDDMREKDKDLFSDFDTWRDEQIKNGKGFVKATWGHNLMTGYACVFLDENNRCKIHESKPMEGRESFGCKKGRKKNFRLDCVKYWKKHQDFIKLLES